MVHAYTTALFHGIILILYTEYKVILHTCIPRSANLVNIPKVLSVRRTAAQDNRNLAPLPMYYYMKANRRGGRKVQLILTSALEVRESLTLCLNPQTHWAEG